MLSDVTNSSHLNKDSSHYVDVTVTVVLSLFWATLYLHTKTTFNGARRPAVTIRPQVS